MPYDSIVSDWNNTMLKFPTDGELNKAISYAALGDALRHLDLKRAAGIASVKGKLEQALQQYEEGTLPLESVYKIFEDSVLKGMPVDAFGRCMTNFAKKHKDKLDHRVLICMHEMASEKDTGIYSLSMGRNICEFLIQNGYTHAIDKVVANYLSLENGKIAGFLEYRSKKTPEELQTIFGRADRILFIGDIADKNIAEALPRGHFIVPFMETDENKQSLAAKYGAFVPKDGTDLLEYLRKK